MLDDYFVLSYVFALAKLMKIGPETLLTETREEYLGNAYGKAMVKEIIAIRKSYKENEQVRV